ncbi:MAG: hypothetical protein HY247_04105 [archaeon]|nr:MAG: hypothetical protein HY247_04105 [archaeon]
MIGGADRKRVRPSLKNFAYSGGVLLAAVYVSGFLPFDSVLEPLGAMLATGSAVGLFRYLRLRSRIPKPYGEGKITEIDAARAARSGLLMVAAGGAVMVALVGGSYFIPGAILFTIIFGLIGGLPLQELIFFLTVVALERRSVAKLYAVTQETEVAGRPLLRKTVEVD